MRNKLRSAGALVAGFVVASLVMMAIESFNGRVLYPELGRAARFMTDRQQLRQILATAPVGAFLVVILGWALGSLAGGFVTARIAARTPVVHALALGALLTLAGIANNLMIPPPLWFWVAGLVVFLPSAWAGARLTPPRAA